MNIQEIIQKAKILPTQDQIHLASQLLQWIEQKNALPNQTVNDYDLLNFLRLLVFVQLVVGKLRC